MVVNWSCVGLLLDFAITGRGRGYKYVCLEISFFVFFRAFFCLFFCFFLFVVAVNKLGCCSLGLGGEEVEGEGGWGKGGCSKQNKQHRLLLWQLGGGREGVSTTVVWLGVWVWALEWAGAFCSVQKWNPSALETRLNRHFCDDQH